MGRLIWSRTVFVVAASLLAALSGLYADQTEAFWGRLVYWFTLIGAGVLLGEALSRLTDGFKEKLPVPAYCVMLSVMLTIPIAGMVLLLQTAAGEPLEADQIASLLLKVWVVTIVIVSFRVRQATNDADKENTPEAPTSLADTAPTAANGLQARLKAPYATAEIWALSAEDHYVRVHTSEGETLVLMRFSDAVDQMTGTEGLSVHRSWWVARNAVNAISRTSGGAEIILKSGASVPVARRRISVLKEEGWFA